MSDSIEYCADCGGLHPKEANGYHEDDRTMNLHKDANGWASPCHKSNPKYFQNETEEVDLELAAKVWPDDPYDAGEYVSDTPETDAMKQKHGFVFTFNELLRLSQDQNLLCKKLERDRNVLQKALQAAVNCGMVPKSSVSDGGACKYSEQVYVADQIRSALKATQRIEQ